MSIPTSELRDRLDEAYATIGGLRARLATAEARVAELEAFIRFVHDQLELNGAPL